MKQLISRMHLCCGLLTLFFAGCVAEPAVNRPPAGEGECAQLCSDKERLDLVFAEDETGLETWVALHYSGTLETDNENVTIEAISNTASQIWYQAKPHEGLWQVHEDLVNLTLKSKTGERITGLEIPVKYEWYQKFNVIVDGGDYFTPQYDIPANVVAADAAAAGLIKAKGPNTFELVGGYADWEVTYTSSGLIIAPEKGQGPASLTVSFADHFQHDAGSRTFHYSIRDSHSGKRYQGRIDADYHERSISLSDDSFSKEVLSDTTLDELSWSLDITDATAALLPERGAVWRFVNIPEGFSVEPSSGDSRVPTSVTIQADSKIRAQSSADYFFEIEGAGQTAGQKFGVNINVHTQLPFLKSVATSRINVSGQPNMLIDIGNQHRSFDLFVNTAPVKINEHEGFFRLAEPLGLGEATWSVIDQYSEVFDDRVLVVIDKDQQYPLVTADLGYASVKTRFQSSSQSIITLDEQGRLRALIPYDGSWRLMNCSGGLEVVDFEIGFDDVLVISRNELFTLNVSADDCWLGEVDLSTRKSEVSYPGLDFIGIKLVPGDDFAQGYLAIDVGLNSTKYDIYTWRFYFGGTLEVGPLSWRKGSIVSNDRLVFIDPDMTFLDAAYPPAFWGLTVASVGYRGNHIIYTSGEISERLDHTEHALRGAIEQHDGDFGVANVIANDGLTAWRLFKNDERLWLVEYNLALLAESDVAEKGREIHLSIPEGFSWLANDFKDLTVTPDGRFLMVTLNQWLWAVPLTTDGAVQ